VDASLGVGGDGRRDRRADDVRAGHQKGGSGGRQKNGGASECGKTFH